MVEFDRLVPVCLAAAMALAGCAVPTRTGGGISTVSSLAAHPDGNRDDGFLNPVLNRADRLRARSEAAGEEPQPRERAVASSARESDCGDEPHEAAETAD